MNIQEPLTQSLQKIKIGILGGTFDPPHNGHIAIAKQAKEQFKLDAVYFVPAYIPPHKLNNSSTVAKHRLKMVKLAITKMKKCFISDIEIKRKGVSYTVDTLSLFKKRFPKSHLFLIIGADNLDQFSSWKSPEAILKLATLVVYGRKGFNRPTKNLNVDFHRIKGKLLNVSSTEIRKRIEKGQSISKLVPKTVEIYIKKQKVYSRLIELKRINYEINCSHR